jgi:membrane-bound lytic murein transglycosylase F
MILAYARNKIVLSLFILIGISCIYFSDTSDPKENADITFLSPPSFDLEKIIKRGKLIAITDNSSTSFYLFKGDSMGYEYELLHAFAKEIGVELEMVIAKDVNSIFYQLNNGEADIIAANLTVTQERMTLVDFTDPFIYVPQVLIQRKPVGWEDMTTDELNKKLIKNVVDLNGKSVHVRKGSSFYARLQNLSEEIGGNINIIEAEGKYVTEVLISKVANGEIDYTIADENVALNNQTYFSNIDCETAVSLPQKIAWAVRRDCPTLRKALNEWIAKRKGTKEINAVYAKYFKTSKKIYANAKGRYASNGTISMYDDLIKSYSKKINWDWELLASLIYQESHFSPTARSWAGANGLMQLVPGTAKHYGLDTLDVTAEQSIAAGTSYISDLDKYWRTKISDKNERIKFVLASYNVGIGHVIDARNLTAKYGKDPNVWFDNVEYMILQKSNPMIYNDPIVKCGYCRGQEPYLYVKEILDRYHNYRRSPVKTQSIVAR